MAKNKPFYGEGRYNCEITDQGLTKASTGTVQIALRFKVLEGTSPAREVTQYERTAFMAVTEKTMPYLIPKLDVLGYNRDGVKFLDLKHPQAHDLRGIVAEFFCKHENDRDGDLREKWDIALTNSEPLELKPPDAKDLRQLDMLFAKSRKSAGVAPKPSLSPATTAEPPQQDWQASDEDVPF